MGDISMSIKCSLDNDFIELYNRTDPKLLKVEGIQMEQLDVFKIADEFTENHVNSIIDENANVSSKFGKSYGMFQTELLKSIQKLRGYNDLYKVIKTEYNSDIANEIIGSVFNGDLYLHDSCYIQIPYCWATSVQSLVNDGIQYNDQLSSYPPKKRRSFIDMVKEFIIQLSHEVAGAVAISDLFVYYSYYVKCELDIFRNSYGMSKNITYSELLTTKLRKEIEDDFQSLVHTLNMKLRSVAQSPFTNVSIFDMANLELLFKDVIFPDGSEPDFKLIMDIQKIFCDWFSKGDPTTGLPYRFPVCTLNIRIDDNKNVVDKETFNYFCRINMNNSPFNVYISSGHKIASCCRLLSSYENHFDSMGNGGTSIGSIRVCTINLPRIGHLVKERINDIQNKESINNIIDEELKKKLNNCEIILRCHRKLIENQIKNGFLPFFNNGIMSLKRLFCTIGINGIFECVNEINNNPLSEEGMEYYKRVLGGIREYAENASKSGVLFNCEEVPAESLASKFALKDNIMYGMKYDIYSNQFVPLSANVDLSERISFEGRFSKYLSGGCITHINMIEKMTSIDQMKRLMLYIIKCGVEHYAINYNFCMCENNHLTTNKPNQPCKECGKPVQEYTRIIGYFVPTDQFSSGRKKEHKTRVFY
jgi:ribonucleoside-triphosphate reductase